MVIRITGRAEVTHDGGTPVTAGPVTRQLDGAESDDVCSNYLDSALADLGITRGTVKLTYDTAEGRFRVSSEYTAPVKLKPAQLKKLARETMGLWSDGIGEGCFDDLAERLGVTIDLAPHDQDKDLRVEQIDDGTKPRKIKTAHIKAAREGDLTKLRKHLDEGADLEARVQGYTALQLAVIYGHAEAALELIARGADINVRCGDGEDPLTCAATSNAMTDADAVRLARVLLERGVSVYGAAGPDANPDDPFTRVYTPLYMAENRKKTQLAAVLREFGATK